jgi:AcrR family transcriptional regulator
VTGIGLRERKKARTRQAIAAAAARLFAQHGYEQVAVRDVAREAEVSEQTVYNYFQTKEQLVTDYDQQVQDELSRLIRARAPGTTPATAIREFVLDTVEGIRRVPAEQWRGELGYLASISPTVHRLALEMADRQADVLATAISETTPVAPEIARLHGIALAGVFQIIISETGRRTRQGQSQDQIANELKPAIKALLNDLDHWLTPAHTPTQPTLSRRRPPPKGDQKR